MIRESPFLPLRVSVSPWYPSLAPRRLAPRATTRDRLGPPLFFLSVSPCLRGERLLASLGGSVSPSSLTGFQLCVSVPLWFGSFFPAAFRLPIMVYSEPVCDETVRHLMIMLKRLLTTDY